MLNYLNEMMNKIKANYQDDKVEVMDKLDEELATINPNVLTYNEWKAYQECQTFLWNYYSGN